MQNRSGGTTVAVEGDDTMKVAIIGMGIVGRGAYEIIKEELAPEIEVKYVMDLREVDDVDCIVTKEIDQIISDPEVDLVIESIGGLSPAYEFITASLKAGKSVVTANKHLISKYYKNLHKIARENNACLEFTPSAGGGIPWLVNLRRTRRCGQIHSISGIINGTTNFILDNMTRSGVSFDEALKQAQSRGYAEADPSADIDGLDVQRKCAISVNIAYDAVIDPEDIPTEGIRNITECDIRVFRSMGKVCRLICRGAIHDGKISAYVEPTLFSADSLEANVSENNNLITLNGKNVGRLSFYGQGAGRYPTAHSMVEDVVDIYLGQKRQADLSGVAEVDNSAVLHSYYVRADDLSFIEGRAVRYIGKGIVTGPVSVEEMHRLAKERLDAGDKLFFAAMNE